MTALLFSLFILIPHPNLRTGSYVEVQYYFTTTTDGVHQDVQTIRLPNFGGNSVSRYLSHENTRTLDYKFVMIILRFADEMIKHTEPVDFESFDCHSRRFMLLRRQKGWCLDNSDVKLDCPLSYSIQPDNSLLAHFLIIVVSEKVIASNVDILITETCRTVAKLSIADSDVKTFKVHIGSYFWEIGAELNRKDDLSVDIPGVKLKITYKRIDIQEELSGTNVFKVSILILPKLHKESRLNFYHFCFNTNEQELTCDALFFTTIGIGPGDYLHHFDEFRSTSLYVFKAIIDNGDDLAEEIVQYVGETSVYPSSTVLGSESQINNNFQDISVITIDSSERYKPTSASFKFYTDDPHLSDGTDLDYTSRLKTTYAIQNYKHKIFYNSVQVNGVHTAKHFLADQNKSFYASDGQGDGNNAHSGHEILVNYDSQSCDRHQDVCQKVAEIKKEKLSKKSKKKLGWVWIVLTVTTLVYASIILSIIW
ncbi:hypothetical protein RF11_11370 [Thelohanellus kitauei]|uniref:Uncharacterized protein n=1 Tax=Thelohanellus kitauei TaxID=669202 RepID=A0A0C2MJ94_THEKT|nr:hypothetical protein RF11_11370 [Thelohanellus kitauei]